MLKASTACNKFISYCIGTLISIPVGTDIDFIIYSPIIIKGHAVITFYDDFPFAITLVQTICPIYHLCDGIPNSARSRFLFLFTHRDKLACWIHGKQSNLDTFFETLLNLFAVHCAECRQTKSNSVNTIFCIFDIGVCFRISFRTCAVYFFQFPFIEF